MNAFYSHSKSSKNYENSERRTVDIFFCSTILRKGDFDFHTFQVFLLKDTKTKEVLLLWMWSNHHNQIIGKTIVSLIIISLKDDDTSLWINLWERTFYKIIPSDICFNSFLFWKRIVFNKINLTSEFPQVFLIKIWGKSYLQFKFI